MRITKHNFLMYLDLFLHFDDFVNIEILHLSTPFLFAIVI